MNSIIPHPLGLEPKPIPEPDSPISPAMLLRAIRKHWYIVVGFVVASVTGFWLYTANQTKIYEAVATVQFDPQPLTPLGHSSIDSGASDYWSNLEYFATQHQVIRSRKIAALVVQKLGLEKDGGFLSNQPGPGAPRKVTVEAAAEVLRNRIKIEPIQDSRLALVKLTDADQARAQRILSTVVDTYVDQNLDTSIDASNKTSEWLDTQLVRLRGSLESQEMALHDFKKQYNLLSVSYDDQTNMLRAEIQQLNANLTSIKTRREALNARLAVLNNVNPDDPANLPTGDVVGSESISGLREAYIAAKVKALSLRAEGKDDMHPVLRVANAQVETAREALMNELRNIKAGCAMDMAAVNKELAGLSSLYEGAKSQAMELNLKELEFSRLQRSKENTQKLFGLVLERSTESGISKMMPFNNVRVLDRPLKPNAPVYPKTSGSVAMGLLVGMVLGLAGAVGRDLLDRTVRSSEDAERELGVVALGSLPDLARDGGKDTSYYGASYGQRPSRRSKNGSRPARPEGMTPELLVHTHPKSVIAEAARAIRTNLMFMSPDHPYRCLLITSAGPAEGKTTVAACVAIAMAQAGQSVCLVDCDLRRPRVHTLFGGDNAAGVTTALLDMSQLDSVIMSGMAPNLSVIPAGPTPPNPADLMHSDAFGRFIEVLRERFDRIVIDSPPIGLVTDGVVLATRVDATVMVVRALTTRRDAARKAMRSLRDVGANCAGFVLNAVQPTGRGAYYSGYYGAYGAYGASPEPEGATPTGA